MRDEQKIQYYRSKTLDELREILKNPDLPESDVVIATFEKHDKEDELGIAKYYTTEEVLENIFGTKVKLAWWCKQWLKSNI